MPGWVKATLDEWVQAGNLTAGRLFRRVNKNGKAWGDGLTERQNGTLFASTPAKRGSKGSHLTLLGGPVRGSVMLRVANSNRSRFYWARLNSNDRAIPRLQAANSGRRQRPDRHRTRGLNVPAPSPDWRPHRS